MSKKYMRIKKMAIPALTFVLLITQLTGCNVNEAKDMLKAINNYETIVIEVAEPSVYKITNKGTEKEEVSWIQLDQIKTYNSGLQGTL